jgi:hypothetical protein
MHATLFLRQASRLGCAVLLATVGAASHAQTPRKIQSAPQPAAPANAATLGLPKPGGLTSQFPAGLPETGVMGSAGTPIGVAPATTTTNEPAGTVTTPGTSGTTTTGNTGTVPTTTTNGAGVNAAGVASMGAGAPQGPVSGPAGSYTPLQIAQSFLGADANHDGNLTRAEFQRLTIKPYTFEEMDADHDGIVTRSEYENAVR